MTDKEQLKILYQLIPTPFTWVEGRPVFDSKEQYVLYMAIRERIYQLGGSI